MEDREFFQYMDEEARAVEASLELLLPSASAHPTTIHEAMRYATLGGGKRLRGILVREAARLGKGIDGGKLPGASNGGAPASLALTLTPWRMREAGAVGAVSAAVEMIHAYSLVHDDLPCIDNDDFRRGRLTTHKVYGEGMAVLAGDALLTRAFEVLVHLPWAGVEPEVALAVLQELAVACGTAGLIGGQVADIEAEGSLRPASGVDLAAAKRMLEYIHTHKTGALFRASLRSGALLGGLDRGELAHVTVYAEALGVAFQITDDLLDVVGDAQELGKSVGKDERVGKLTYPALYGVDASRKMAEEQVEKAEEALHPFGERARFLRRLIRFVYERKR